MQRRNIHADQTKKEKYFTDKLVVKETTTMYRAFYFLNHDWVEMLGEQSGNFAMPFHAPQGEQYGSIFCSIASP